MSVIVWDFSGFNISMKSQYTDIYALERDIRHYSGSSNFSEMDSLDWFLTDNRTGQLSFMLLTVPSVIRCSSDDCRFALDDLQQINLTDCVSHFAADVSIQQQATYFVQQNHLVVASDDATVFYKVSIADGLYFLLNKAFGYQGFVLIDATKHIAGYCSPADDAVFLPLLLRMMAFFKEQVYDALDNKEPHYLAIINQLEKDCSDYQLADNRVGQLLEFIRNLKAIFYDIEIDSI